MTEPLKVIIDTSVFVSAYITKSETHSPKKVLQEWKNGTFTLALSPQLINEIVLTLYDKNVNQDFIEELVFDIEAKALELTGNYHTNYLDDIDPKDNIVLGAALETSADYIVTLDKKHLIPIIFFHRTHIIYPNRLLNILEKKKELICSSRKFFI